jgi:hypothetical protein
VLSEICVIVRELILDKGDCTRYPFNVRSARATTPVRMVELRIMSPDPRPSACCSPPIFALPDVARLDRGEILARRSDTLRRTTERYWGGRGPDYDAAFTPHSRCAMDRELDTSAGERCHEF